MNRRLAMLTVAVILAVGLPTALLGPDPAAARTRRVTKSFEVRVACTSTGSLGECQPPHEQSVTTSGVLRVEFVANPAHCTPIEVAFRTNFGGLIRDHPGGGVVGPGESTGVVDLGTHRGAGKVLVFARDAPGGSGPCADGPLKAWEGTLKVTTSKRLRR